MTSYDTFHDVGVLILRLVLGVTLAAHGYNKFFGGGRIPGTASWFESIGMKPGKFHATVAATTEIAAGLGLAAGFLTPIPAAGFVSLMVVAAWTVHRANGFFIVKEGWEYNLVLAVSAVGGHVGRGQVQPGSSGLREELDGRVARIADLGGARPGRRHWAAGDLLPAAGQASRLIGGRPHRRSLKRIRGDRNCKKGNVVVEVTFRKMQLRRCESFHDQSRLRAAINATLMS